MTRKKPYSKIGYGEAAVITIVTAVYITLFAVTVKIVWSLVT